MDVNPILANNLVSNIENNQNNKSNNDSVNFSDILKNALNDVNNKQLQAEDSTQKLMTGDADNIHDVLIATTEAQLSLELTVQIRNKIVEAYQEINRTQI